MRAAKIHHSAGAPDARAQEDDGAGEHNVSENRVVVFVRRFLPVADHYSGDSFFTVVDGRRMATPLLLVLVVVELTDVARAPRQPFQQTNEIATPSDARRLRVQMRSARILLSPVN